MTNKTILGITFLVSILSAACAGNTGYGTYNPVCSDEFNACAADKSAPIKCAGGVCECASPSGSVSSCQAAVWCSELPTCGLGSTGLCCPTQTIPDFCRTHTLAQLSAETLSCSTASAATCAFDSDATAVTPDPLTAGESICECRTTADHPDPSRGIYYCFPG